MTLINLANLLRKIYNSDGHVNVFYICQRCLNYVEDWSLNLGEYPKYMVLTKQQRKCIYHYRHT